MSDDDILIGNFIYNKYLGLTSTKYEPFFRKNINENTIEPFDNKPIFDYIQANFKSDYPSNIMLLGGTSNNLLITYNIIRDPYDETEISIDDEEYLVDDSEGDYELFTYNLDTKVCKYHTLNLSNIETLHVHNDQIIIYGTVVDDFGFSEQVKQCYDMNMIKLS